MKKDLAQLTVKLPLVPKYLRRKLPLGWLQCEILFSLDSLANDAYGVSVGRFLNQKLSRDNNLGLVYGTLQSLERLRYVVGKISPSPHGKGRDITVYRITPLGYAAVRATLIMVEAAEKMKDADS